MKKYLKRSNNLIKYKTKTKNKKEGNIYDN